MIINKPPDTMFIVRCETYLLKISPAAMAIIEATIKARVPAIKMAVLLTSLWDAKENVAMFVLSPNSASRIVIKIKKKSLKFKNYYSPILNSSFSLIRKSSRKFATNL